MHESESSGRGAVGRLADGSWQIGVRRTLPCSEGQLWRVLLSDVGLRVWLGGVTTLNEGAEFVLENGTTGKVTVFRSGSHLRMRWQAAGWEHASVLQVRVLAARQGTTLGFHQEGLPDAKARVAMKVRWEFAIEQLAALIRGNGALTGS